MLIIPAVDIIQGKVVRLAKGSFKEIKEYSNNPMLMAKFWQEEGAKFLHIVDLDGAAVGKPTNLQVISNIIREISIPAEVGGGIRTIEDVRKYARMNVDRVVLGTAVTEDLSFLDKQDIISISNKLAISCDARMSVEGTSGVIMTGTNAWLKETPVNFDLLISKMVTAGIKYLNFTDRSKDGMLTGLSNENVKYLESFLNLIGDKPIQVIYAGGISSLDDIKNLANLKHPRLAGVIIGKALYENKFNLKEAQEAANVS